MDGVEITCQEGWSVEDAIDALVASVGTDRLEAEYQRLTSWPAPPTGTWSDGDPPEAEPHPLDPFPDE
jgi:hypothetical protein